MSKIRVTRIGHPKPPLKEKSPRKRMRKSRLNPVNRKRKAERFETDFGGATYHDWLTSLPCDLCGVMGLTVAAHLTTRGAGGKAEDTAPLCHTTIVTQWEPRRFDKHGIQLVTSYTRIGCHERYDAHDPEIRKHEPRLRKLAAARWQSHIESLEKQK